MIILFLAIFIRFNRVAELGYFMMDEERDGFLVNRMLVDHRPLLIGGSIPGGINIGPLFFYLSAIPYALSNLNPIGPAGAAAIIGVIGVIGVFVVGKELFGRRTGLLAAVFAGFSLVNIVYQRPWWPLTMSQVVTLTVYLVLFKLWKGPTPPRRGRTLINWLWVLVLALIVGAQSDPSTLSLIPLSIIWLWWYRRRIGLTRKHYLMAAGLFVLAHATWFIFELRHDFQSTRAIISLLGTLFKGQSLQGLSFLGGWAAVMKMTAATVYRLFIPTGDLDVTKQISPAAEFLADRMNRVWRPVGWGVLLVIGSYIIGSLVGQPKIKQESPVRTARRLPATHFLVSLVGILAYTMMFPGYVHEWMWAFMFPSFFLIFSELLVKLGKLVKFGRLGVTVAIIFWSAWQLSLFLKLENVAGLGKKLEVVKLVQKEIAGRPYELRSEGADALRYGGWRYLFTLYGKPPVKSYMDYVYQGWVYPKNEVEPEVIVAINNLRDKSPTFILSENSENSESQISPDSQNF